MISSATGQAGQTLWAITDNNGSVVDVVGNNGSGNTILNHIMYDSFGNTVSQSNSADALLMGFDGYIQDSITGLYYANARFYSAQLGRFINQDPSGFAAGDSNLYRFVGNHPTYATDPTGLYEGGSTYSGGLTQYTNGAGVTTDVGTAPTSLTGGGGYSNNSFANTGGPISGPTAGPISQGLYAGNTGLGGGGYGGNFGSSAAFTLPTPVSQLPFSSPSGGYGSQPTTMAPTMSQSPIAAYIQSLNNPQGSSNPSFIPWNSVNQSAVNQVNLLNNTETVNGQEYGISPNGLSALPPAYTGPSGPTITRVFGGVQTIGGAGESLFGLAMLGGGTVSEAGSGGASTPISVPAAILGSIWTANGADNIGAGLQSLFSGSQTPTVTAQTVTALTSSPAAGAWANAGIGLSSGMPGIFRAVVAETAPTLSLPAYDGQTTYGILATNKGTVSLQSGESLYPNYVAAGHVEGKAALWMRENEASFGALWHNNPNGTCGYCDAQIGTLLPENATLQVFPPANAVANNSRAVAFPWTYTGNSKIPNLGGQ